MIIFRNLYILKHKDVGKPKILKYKQIPVNQTYLGKTMEYFEKVSKLKIPTATEAISITSSDAQIPKCFSKPNAYFHRVVGSLESFFDRVLSFKEWDSTTDGLKDTLQSVILSAWIYLSDWISETFTVGSPEHTAALRYVVQSVKFILELTNYIDRLYIALTRSGKFLEKRACHLVTRISKHFL